MPHADRRGSDSSAQGSASMAWYKVAAAGHQLEPNDLLFDLDLSVGNNEVFAFANTYDELGASKGRRYLPRAWVKASVRLSGVDNNESPAEQAFIHWLATPEANPVAAAGNAYADLSFAD